MLYIRSGHMDLFVGETSIDHDDQDLQRRQTDVSKQRAGDLAHAYKSLVEGEAADVPAIPCHRGYELHSARLCPDSTTVSTGEDRDMSPFFNDLPYKPLKPATELAFSTEISTPQLHVMTIGQQPTALEIRGQDTPDGLFRSVFRLWKKTVAPHQLEGQQLPINILERHTQLTVYHFLWWSNSMLLTGAPDFCAAAALFKISFIKPYEGGYIVQLLSLLEDKLLCVDCSAKEPVFVLLSQMEARKPTVQRQYRLGPGDSQYKSFHFQHPTTKDWYYWLIEGGTVVLRNQGYVDSSEVEVLIFLTKPKDPECS